jgi:hypothetical protein
MVRQEVIVSTRTSRAITWKVIASNDPVTIIPEKRAINVLWSKRLQHVTLQKKQDLCQNVFKTSI